MEGMPPRLYVLYVNLVTTELHSLQSTQAAEHGPVSCSTYKTPCTVKIINAKLLVAIENQNDPENPENPANEARRAKY